jgi:hypothetical protein
MDDETAVVHDRPTVAAEGAHDHPILVEDAGVPELTLVGIADGDVGRADERRVGADREQPKSARNYRIALQRNILTLFSGEQVRRILAVAW